MKLMILDGNSVINRAFYGVRLLSTKDGQYTNAIYGFLNILQRMEAEEQPDALCVAFDLHGPTFRHLQYDGYKATRHGMPEELAQQMPVLKDVLRAMRIPIYECQGWEADDVIGTVCRICREDGWDCVVVTGDRDSLQLVNDRVSVKLVVTKGGQTNATLYTPETFQAEYGFAPIRLIDLKSLMGDSSDNIPGVAGVGPKTATDLLLKFGTLDGVYENLSRENMKGKLFDKLEAGKDSAYLSYDLATIRLNAPIEFAPQDAIRREPDKKALYDLFLKLEFVKLIDKYGLRKAAFEEEAAPQPEQPAEAEVTVFAPSGLAEVRALFDGFPEGTALAVRASGDLRAVAVDDGEHMTVLSEQQLGADYDAALRALFSGKFRLSTHGSKALIRGLLSRGLPAFDPAFDTEVAAYLLDAARGKYELPALALQYWGVELPTEAGILARMEDRRDKPRLSADDQGSSLQQDRKAAAEMAILESEATAISALVPILTGKMQEQGLERLYSDIDLPLCRVLAEMEDAGVLVDSGALHAFDEMLKAGIADCQQAIWRYAGEEFNVNSTKKLGEILFEKLGLPAGKKTKTGYSTNVEVLEKLRGKHPIIGSIMEYRTLTKLQSTYADGLLKVVCPDGRVRTTFQNTVTSTGRLSSTDPNLQNIPVRTDLGSEIRKMFVPQPGWVLVDADYSQIELRVLAHMADDKAMQAAFLSGEDVHRVTASQVFGVPLDEVTAQMRRNAKAVNFGIVYGISEFSLAEDIGVSRWEAREYIDNYLTKYHGVRDFMKNTVENAKKDGYVSTLYGRRRWLPELHDGKYMVRQAAERMAMNAPIQGTAADIIKLAMLRVDRALKAEGLQARLVLQVHDELIVECPGFEAEAVMQLVTREMSQAAKLAVPLIAEAHMGRSWYEAK